MWQANLPGKHPWISLLEGRYRFSRAPELFCGALEELREGQGGAVWPVYFAKFGVVPTITIGFMWKYVEICGHMWTHVEICGNMRKQNMWNVQWDGLSNFKLRYGTCTETKT